MPQKHVEYFRLLLDHLTWIKHKYLSGIRDSRKTGRDDERCGRSKEVNTQELIGQIKNFMDKDRHVSVETISAQFDVSVGTVHTIICEKLKMRKICAKFVPRVLREDQKERHCHDSREMVELINSDPAVLDALVTWDKSWIYCYDPEIPSEEASTLQIGSVAFPPGQCTSPQLHPCHRLFDQDGHKDSFHPPYSPDLAACDFCLFPKLKEKLRGCRYETIEEMKEAVMKVIDTLTQEDFHEAFQMLLEW